MGYPKTLYVQHVTADFFGRAFEDRPAGYAVRYDMHVEEQAEIARLRADLAAEKSRADLFAEIVKNCAVTAGYCCCGDPIDSHGMDSGHSPVDYGAYQAEKALDAHRKARGL